MSKRDKRAPSAGQAAAGQPIQGAAASAGRVEAAAVIGGILERIDETGSARCLEALDNAIAAGRSADGFAAAAADLGKLAGRLNAMTAQLDGDLATLESPAATTAHALAALDKLLALGGK
jgi:hypothetical protein